MGTRVGAVPMVGARFERRGRGSWFRGGKPLTAKCAKDSRRSLRKAQSLVLS